MSNRTIDAITTDIAQLSRRASLLTLGGMAIAALTQPATAGAARKSRKPKKVRKKLQKACAEQTRATCEIEANTACETCSAQAQADCANQAQTTREAQAGDCLDMVTSICQDATNPQKCVLKFGECCESLTTGDVSSAVRCLLYIPD